MEGYFGECGVYLETWGLVCLGYVLLKLTLMLLRVSRRAVSRSFPVDVKQYGQWAVVTGCTDGIGKCYAQQLAEKGMDMVLISRNPDKLSAVAEEIGQRYKVSVKTFAADFKKTDIYDAIRQQLKGLEIGVLVNNVGMSNPGNFEYFCEMENFEQLNKDMINVNVLSCVMMTGLILPDMLTKKRGTIINIASVAGLRPTPFLATYSATKAFVRFFSEALKMEYSSHGVFIQLVMPEFVKTNMVQTLDKGLGFNGLQYPSPDTYVRHAMRTIGRESSTVAYWVHELEQFSYVRIPDFFLASNILQKKKTVDDFFKKQ